MIARWLQREKVHAIHKRDLETILRDLEMLDALVAGALRCASCGAPMTVDTLQCLFTEENEIRCCCTNAECYERVLSQKGKGKR